MVSIDLCHDLLDIGIVAHAGTAVVLLIRICGAGTKRKPSSPFDGQQEQSRNLG